MSLSPPEPPDNVGSGGSEDRRMTLFGAALWLIVAVLIALMFFIDAGRGELESAFEIAVRVGLITILALVAGAIVYQILKRLNLAGAFLTNIFWGALLSVGLPLGGLLAAQHFGMLPASDVLIGEIIEALPISDEAFEGISQAREVLTGGE